MNIAAAFAHFQHPRYQPVSTYRIQLRPEFGFAQAAELVPYLHRLGITHLYCSPFLKAAPGSTHGYDTCDYSSLNPELGSEDDFQHLMTELDRVGMAAILDIVPNHMAVESVHNPWWRGMLEDGPSAPSAIYFDVDWRPVKRELRGKILLPFLGDAYGNVLERGELQLEFLAETGELVLRYFNIHRPLDPKTYPHVLKRNIQHLEAQAELEPRDLQEFFSIITSLENLPGYLETDADRIQLRQREKVVAKDRLKRLLESNATIRQHVLDNIQQINGDPTQPDSFDTLHEILEEQPYRLAYWKTAFHEINYRRFFDINTLAGLRMEDPQVFAGTHALLLDLVGKGHLTGFRLDHLDGLFDPLGYLQQLQAHIVFQLVRKEDPNATWEEFLPAYQQYLLEHPTEERTFYVVAEKILSGSEHLPISWPVRGTSGYDFLNDVNRLFVDSTHTRKMKRIFQKYTGRHESLPEVIYHSKKLITETAMSSELNVLAHALNRISEADRKTRDYTLESIREALRELVACFPVYRTYVNGTGFTEEDRRTIDQAISRAKVRNPAMEDSVFEFIRSVLLPDPTVVIDPEDYRKRLHFSMQFQQYTGPVQAKGLEDTAFYRYNVLVSLNEVGGDPQRFGGTIAQFHEANRHRAAQWPQAMLATATHDTKRGEDARARISVISTIPNLWEMLLARWQRYARRHRSEVHGLQAPDRNEEYLFYQMLIAIWPAEPHDTLHHVVSSEIVDRLKEYLNKATKEAKVFTSWLTPNVEYQEALEKFVTGMLTGLKSHKFLAEFLQEQHQFAHFGMLNSLSTVVLKLTSPGVPDFYQGTELWDLSMVDPDNRRPVDYSMRQQMLTELVDAEGNLILPTIESCGGMLQNWYDGLLKMWLTTAGLNYRRTHRNLFLHGDYLPLEVRGRFADNLVAFARVTESAQCLVVAPRLCNQLGAINNLPLGKYVWGDTHVVLPAPLNDVCWQSKLSKDWQVRATDSMIAVGDLLHHLPVGLYGSE
ncbi:MAG: malto-oligosyltrehalose synthase [Zavarzinella sp.]